jgi:hypothetical protein
MTEFWNGIDTRYTYTHRVEIAGDGIGKIFLAPVKADWLSSFPLQFGEMLYQLRAALDSCVYDCAILQTGKNPPPDERDLQFPICTNSKSFKNCLGQIRPLSDDVKAFIESVQPYQTAPLTIGRELIDIAHYLSSELFPPTSQPSSDCRRIWRLNGAPLTIEDFWNTRATSLLSRSEAIGLMRRLR